MRTQQDRAIRVVALDNLIAMCEATNGQYWLERVTRSRIWVGTRYQTDEYGGTRNMFAVFPCYPSGYSREDADNPRVVLDVHRIVGAHPMDHNPIDSFWDLLDLTAGRGPDGTWWAYPLPKDYDLPWVHFDAIREAYNAHNPPKGAPSHVLPDA